MPFGTLRLATEPGTPVRFGLQEQGGEMEESGGVEPLDEMSTTGFKPVCRPTQRHSP